jgi:predicted secreted protein
VKARIRATAVYGRRVPHALRRYAAVLLGVSALAGLAGCGEDEPESGPQVFTDPSSIEIASGESFDVELESNPSTGYAWEVDGQLDEEVLTYEGSEYTPDEGSEDLVGSGGTERLSFTAGAAGEAVIELTYVPPDGKAGPEDERRQISVTVTES